MVGLFFPCVVMDMSLYFLPSSSCLYPSLSPNQIYFRHLCFYFYGSHPVTPSIVVTPAVKQWHRNQVKKTRQVSLCASVCGNQNQFTQTDVHRHKPSNAFIWKETIRDNVKRPLGQSAEDVFSDATRRHIPRQIGTSLCNQSMQQSFRSPSGQEDSRRYHCKGFSL